jgi:hypothetical protein
MTELLGLSFVWLGGVLCGVTYTSFWVARRLPSTRVIRSPDIEAVARAIAEKHWDNAALCIGMPMTYERGSDWREWIPTAEAASAAIRSGEEDAGR